MGAAAALELEGVTKRFEGLEALAGITLQVPERGRLAVIGPNGAGKTTLFNVITGELPPTAGRIRLFGQDVTHLPSYKRTALGLGRTFQITNLFGPLTVEENVLLALLGLSPVKYTMVRPLSRYGGLRGEARTLLEPARLWEKRDMEVRALSYGEQRQLEVLLALASRPRLLLLDEPAAGLSPGERREMAQFIKRLDSSLTIVLIEHDMDVAFEIVDTVAVLHLGRLVAHGPTDAVRANSTVQEIYLGAAHRTEAEV